ncbi:MAG: leucyl/phenylalanyl-tRNA--protein transferase [Magnetospirillum sp. WYHS-4]
MAVPVQRIPPEILLRAYASGVFPMAETRDDPDFFWVDPKRRGILPLDAFHVPRRLKRTLRQAPFEVRCDGAFSAVVRACAESPGPNRRETWINRTIEESYAELHALGFAHSVECWREGELVGGLYGVSLGGAFFGESMFSRVEDASKVALVHLAIRLRLGGYVLLDIQFVTEHLKRFGAVEIPARDYLERLEAALSIPAEFYGDLPEGVLAGAMAALCSQSSTQTS